jgi:hypothetical protein
MTPHNIDGDPILWVYQIDPLRHGRSIAIAGDLEIVSALLISVAREGSDDQAFRVTYALQSGDLVRGRVFSSLLDAKQSAVEELAISEHGWAAVQPP